MNLSPINLHCALTSDRSKNSSFEEKISALKQEKKRNKGAQKTEVLISGAGPAGLSKAIASILNGSPTVVIEKRLESQPGRSNTVILNKESIDLLQRWGIYNYLIDNHLVFDPHNSVVLSVRIEDLEKAMRFIISKLTKKQVIYYGAQISHVQPDLNGKIAVTIQNQFDQAHFQKSVDLLTVAEGARSETTKKLGISRLQVLPNVPVISAIFKDNRPQIKNLRTLGFYCQLTVTNTVLKMYYLTFFLFLLIVHKETPFNHKRNIAGSLILKTPGQHYLGYGLNKEHSETLIALSKKFEDAKLQLRDAERSNKFNNLSQLKSDLIKKEMEYKKFVTHWAYLSFFFANLINILRFYDNLCNKRLQKPNLANWQPLDIEKTAFVEIGADKASKSCGKIGHSPFLIAGDTLATVDPTTGLGCNTALTTTSLFEKVLKGMHKRDNVDMLLNEYDFTARSITEYIHADSKAMRRLYRPDAVST